MNYIDLVLLVGLLCTTLKGWRVGLLKSLSGLLALILAYAFALRYGGEVASWLSSHAAEPASGMDLVGFVLAFLGALVACALAIRILHGMVQATPLGLVNTLGGAALGLSQGLIVLGLVTMFLRAYPPHSRLPGDIDASILAPRVQSASVALMDAIKTAWPRTADLYQKLVPEGSQAKTPGMVEDLSNKASQAGNQLENLLKESKERLKEK